MSLYSNEPVILKGQYVITTDYVESRPKMSLLLSIPKGSILKVTQVFRTDTHEHYRGLPCRYMLMCYNFDICQGFPFPVKSNAVAIADDVTKLLYGNT